MRQFIHGSHEAWADLARRAHHACVVFVEEMPEGASPRYARVGFEINPVTEEALLLVDWGVGYTGANAEVRAWLATGEKRFPYFDQLRTWVEEELALDYAIPVELPSWQQSNEMIVAYPTVHYTDIEDPQPKE